MRYAAFISYSHVSDTARARHLRHGLHAFARPWNRTRALRVFLDNAAMSAEPSLWSTVEQALADSENLILLASPQSSNSEWVGREIDWWRRGPRSENLLLVVTGGEIHWDHEAGDFDFTRSTCLHPRLRGHFNTEPRWVDLRWMSEEHSAGLRDPRFREAVADLAAPLHGRPKDELIGEDVSQRRRFRRFRRSMLAITTALAILATSAAVVAFFQYRAALEQARIATARQLAATALNLGDDDLEVASLLALQANHVRQTPETLSALYQLTTRSPHLVRFVHADATVTALAFSYASRYVAAGTDAGSVTLWSADGSRKVSRHSMSGEINSLAFSEDDRLLAIATSTGDVAVQDMRTGKLRYLSKGGSGADLLTFQPSTHNLAWIDSDNVLKLHKAAAGEAPKHVETGLNALALDLAFRGKRKEVMVASAMGWRLYDDELRTLRSSDDVLFPANGYVSAASPSGNCFGYTKFGGVALSSLEQLLQGEAPGTDGKSSVCGAKTTRFDKEASSLAVSDDRRTAVGTSKGLLLATWDPGVEEAILETLPGVEAPALMAFSPGTGDRLASADGATVALWSLTERAPTMHRHGVSVPDGATVESQPLIAQGPRGELAWAHETPSDSPLSLHVRSSEGKVFSAAGAPYDSIAFGQGNDTILYTASGNTVEMWAPKGGALSRIRTFTVTTSPDTYGATRIAARPDGRIVVIPADGSVQLIDPETEGRSTTVGEGTRDLVDTSNATYESGFRSAVSEKGSLAAVGSVDGHVGIYELPSGRLRHRLDLDASRLNNLAVSEQGQTLLAVVDGQVLQSWDLRSGKARWRSHGAGSTGLATDRTDTWVATLSGDGTVWLWDASSGDRLGSTTVPWTDISWSGSGGPGWQTTLLFSKNGKHLWTATEGGEIMSWDVSVDAWIDSLCSRVGRHLTQAERERYLTDLSDDRTACRS
ncbi:TIR domain-containing protein [Streptomyces sp. NPDC012461]|nr:TIR domain-containing protein [Streptomyces sp. SID9913]NED18843.1 TIR domain-containing protein [Streptomyces sp. SID9913]